MNINAISNIRFGEEDSYPEYYDKPKKRVYRVPTKDFLTSKGSRANSGDALLKSFIRTIFKIK